MRAAATLNSTDYAANWRTPKERALINAQATFQKAQVDRLSPRNERRFKSLNPSEVHSQLGRVNKSTQRGGGRNNIISGTYNMTDVKLKHGFLKKSQRNLASLDRKDFVKRKPFDINAMGDEEVVSFVENHSSAINANRTGSSSFYQNGMSVLGPPSKIGNKFNTGPMIIEDMANLPNGFGRQGTQLKSPSQAQEDKIRHEISLIQDAAKRVNTDLAMGNGLLRTEPSLPSIDVENKRKILNELGLKNINKIKNVNALMNKIGTP